MTRRGLRPRSSLRVVDAVTNDCYPSAPVTSVQRRGVEAPAVRDALELVLAPVLEHEPGPGNQVLHGLGHEHLRGARLGRDSGADRHGDPADLPVHQLALAGVDAGPDLDAEFADLLADLERTPDRAGGTVERGEEPVPRGVGLYAAPTLQ